MPPSNDRLKIELLIDSNHPDLLQGLEDWLRLGLIVDRQVKILARSQLCSPLPLTDQLEIDAQPTLEPVTAPAAIAPIKRRDRPVHPPRRSWLEQLLQAFMAEIAVVWLLFLGVFLVVASSAAIAAIQWRYVSPVGQYSILLGYTLAFGVAGLWASHKNNLQVTGRMLQIASLLIIPVNFWMMDGFRLWSMPTGWVMMAIGTAALGLLQWRLLRDNSQHYRWNSFLLNGLQWGWSVSFVPITFTYIGTVMTVFIQAIAQRSRNTEEADAAAANADRRRSLPAITIAFSTLLLVVRAVFFAGVPVAHFGFALGIIGWLLYWLDRSQAKTAWLQAGAALLGIGWLMSYMPHAASLQPGLDPLWQPLAISGLALWALGDRLHRFWEKPALLGFWAVGLQAYALLRVLFPVQLRRSVITSIQTAAQLQAGAFELTGLGFFAYIVLTLALARYLKSHQKVQLAILTKQLALGLGLLLALPSLINPLVRAIYFSLCAVLVFVYWWRDRLAPSTSRHHRLIYLCHVCGMIAILSWIDWCLPTLTSPQWAWIWLTGALLEWGFAALSRDRFWQKSAWLLGVAQAACAYPLLFNAIDMDGSAAYNGLFWLLVPAALTGLGSLPRLVYRRQSSVLSIVAALLALVVTFTSLNPLLITLATSTLLLVINTWQLRQLSVAAIAIGTGLLYSGLQAWSLLDRPEPRWYLLFLAIQLWLLWILRDGLGRWKRRDSAETVVVNPALLFLNAANAWAITLASTIGLLLGLFVTVGLSEPGLTLPWYELALAGSVSLIAIFYRVRQQPTDLGLWGLAIGAAILVNLTAEWLALPLAYRVVSILILGFGTWCVGAWWRKVRQAPTHWTSYHGVPLGYGTIAMLLAHTVFTAQTGLYTLAIGLLGLLLGRRSSNLVVLSIMGLLGVTLGAYECLIYQLMQASGGAFGDAVTLLALLPAAIALLYQGFARLLQRLFRRSPRFWVNTSLCHWVLGSLLGLSAPLWGLSATGEWLWIATLALLALTATWQGRQRSRLIYPALWQWTSAIALLLLQILPDAWLGSWGAVLAGAFTCGIYLLPWARWGWPERAWQLGSLGLPLIIALMTIEQINVPALLLTGSCYGVLAWRKQQVRLSYWGVGFAGWGLWRWLNDWSVNQPVWYAAVLSVAVLYVVEVEPTLQVTDAKGRRHLIRCAAIGLFCLSLFYQDTHLWFRSLIALGVAIGLMAIGLVRQTRAYLYVGTLTFFWAVVRTLWLFILDHSLLIWALGLATGAVFIWIAATFEARRSQTLAVVQYWVNELDNWE